ncbi:hypothetical protein [Mesorhizobium sp. M1322]|uniref:hypothetical protein n=1 Tax=Mesorhizobium sp. M1322 TaxID=2957081 RepID=UPI003335699F
MAAMTARHFVENSRSARELELVLRADLRGLAAFAVDGAVGVGGIRVCTLAVELQHQTVTRAFTNRAAAARMCAVGDGRFGTEMEPKAETTMAAASERRLKFEISVI